MNMLSWLERGLPPRGRADKADDPRNHGISCRANSSKGADRGEAKEWVDRVRAARGAGDAARALRRRHARPRELHIFRRPVVQEQRKTVP